MSRWGGREKVKRNKAVLDRASFPDSLIHQGRDSVWFLIWCPCCSSHLLQNKEQLWPFGSTVGEWLIWIWFQGKYMVWFREDAPLISWARFEFLRRASWRWASPSSAVTFTGFSNWPAWPLGFVNNWGRKRIFLICCHYLVPKFKHRVAKDERYFLLFWVLIDGATLKLWLHSFDFIVKDWGVVFVEGYRREMVMVFLTIWWKDNFSPGENAFPTPCGVCQSLRNGEDC